MAELLVNIDVDDLDAGVHFYTEVFGLRVGRRFGRGAVELLGGGAPLYVLVRAVGTPPFAGATQMRDYQRHWTPVHLDFAVADIAAVIDRVVAAGGRRESDVHEHAWGKIVLMADPFGHGLCLIEWKGRGYDEIATGREPGA